MPQSIANRCPAVSRMKHDPVTVLAAPKYFIFMVSTSLLMNLRRKSPRSFAQGRNTPITNRIIHRKKAITGLRTPR